MNSKWWLLLAASCFSAAVSAADPGESRCGAGGTVEKYECFGTSCLWRNTYMRCANTNSAPACNVGDTKCSASGYVQHCTQYAGDPFWQSTSQRCAGDRDPADNAPPGYGGGYGQRADPAPSSYPSGSDSGSASKPLICTPGQQECDDDRRIRRCGMQGGRPAWETVPGSRCGQSGIRN